MWTLTFCRRPGSFPPPCPSDPTLAFLGLIGALLAAFFGVQLWMWYNAQKNMPERPKKVRLVQTSYWQHAPAPFTPTVVQRIVPAWQLVAEKHARHRRMTSSPLQPQKVLSAKQRKRETLKRGLVMPSD